MSYEKGVEKALKVFKAAGLLGTLGQGAMQFANRNPRAAAGLAGGAMTGLMGAVGGAAGAQPGNRMAGAVKGGLTAGAMGGAAGALGMNRMLQGVPGGNALSRIR